MITEGLLLILYGVCIIGCGFTIGAWASLALREADRRQWRDLMHDQFFVIAVSFLLDAIAIGGVAITRLHAHVVDGHQPPVTVSTLFFVSLLACGRAGFVWGRRVDAASPAWRWFCLTTIAWTVTVILWALL